MIVERNLVPGEGHRLNTALLPNYVSRALMHGDSPLQIGQPERRLAVTTIGGSNQVKERIVLREIATNAPLQKFQPATWKLKPTNRHSPT